MRIVRVTVLCRETAVAQEATFFLRGREVFCEVAIQGSRRGGLLSGALHQDPGHGTNIVCQTLLHRLQQLRIPHRCVCTG